MKFLICSVDLNMGTISGQYTSRQYLYSLVMHSLVLTIVMQLIHTLCIFTISTVLNKENPEESKLENEGTLFLSNEQNMMDEVTWCIS